MGRAEPGVRRRGARARECERPGGWERALEILLASLRGGQEAGAGAQGNAGALPRTSARAHKPSLLAAAATISEPSPVEGEPEPEREAERRRAGDAAPEQSCARTARPER